nr:hypothetical protein [uncultured Shinella sp.]
MPIEDEKEHLASAAVPDAVILSPAEQHVFAETAPARPFFEQPRQHEKLDQVRERMITLTNQLEALCTQVRREAGRAPRLSIVKKNRPEADSGTEE